MAGSWSGISRGIEMEEHWTAPKGNSMVGLHRDVGKGRTILFEFLRIEQLGDEIVYLSMPNGRSPATPFPLKEVTGTRVIFEIRSTTSRSASSTGRTAPTCARIEGTMNRKGGQEWRWAPGAFKYITAAPDPKAPTPRPQGLYF